MFHMLWKGSHVVIILMFLWIIAQSSLTHLSVQWHILCIFHIHYYIDLYTLNIVR